MIINPIQLAKFLKDIGPDLYKLGRYLFELYNGNAELAQKHITRIQDYGADLDVGRLRNDAELAELRSRRVK